MIYYNVLMKRLYRSKTNRVFTGLLGGIGEYFNTDPVLERLICVVLLIAPGAFPGLIIYAVAYLLIPEAPENVIRDAEVVSEKEA